MKLEKLSKYVTSGIFSIFDKERKVVYVGCSKNILRSVSSIVEKYSNGFLNHKALYVPNCEFTVLETNENWQYLLAQKTYYVDQYTKDGYTVVQNRSSLRYTAHYEVFLEEIGDTPRVVVFLRNKRYKKIVQAIFETVKEAEDYIRDNYSVFVKPVKPDQMMLLKLRNASAFLIKYNFVLE